MTQLPVLKHRPKASDVTFGRASKMIPTTPIATLLFPIIRPLGRFDIDITSPIGSASFAICLSPSAMPRSLSWSSESLSIMLFAFIFSSAVATSLLFASRISFSALSRLSAASFNTLFLISVSSVPIFTLASYASAQIFSKSFINKHLSLICYHPI